MCAHMGEGEVCIQRHSLTRYTLCVETLCLPTRVTHMHMRMHNPAHAHAMQVRVTQQLNQVFGSHDLSKK